MPPDLSVPAVGLPIWQASQLLGIPAPTMRSWERRYGLPVSTRTPGGHRRYSVSELQQLRLMRDEIARGLKAADAALSVRRLLAMDSPAEGHVTRLLRASERHDPEVMCGVLDDARSELGLGVTIDLVMLPAMRQVGDWWAAGRCGIDQEHATTETIRGWLARSTTLSPPVDYEPLTLLACGPLDQHSIGLEALAALLAERGRGSRLMGPRTSERTLVAATLATGAAAVVVVSLLRAQRRPAVDALEAVARTGTATFYAGNAFAFPAQRTGVRGTYLGDGLADAADVLCAHLARVERRPRRPQRTV